MYNFEVKVFKTRNAMEKNDPISIHTMENGYKTRNEMLKGLENTLKHIKNIYGAGMFIVINEK